MRWCRSTMPTRSPATARDASKDGRSKAFPVILFRLHRVEWSGRARRYISAFRRGHDLDVPGVGTRVHARLGHGIRSWVDPDEIVAILSRSATNSLETTSFRCRT